MELQGRFHQSQAAAEGGIHITNLLNSAAQVEVTIAIYHLDIFSLSASTLREKKQVKWDGKYGLSVPKLKRFLFPTGKYSLSSSLLFWGKISR